MGITELKDLLWKELNDEKNRVLTLTHRDLDESHRVKEEDDFDLTGDKNEDEEDNFTEEDWE